MSRFPAISRAASFSCDTQCRMFVSISLVPMATLEDVLTVRWKNSRVGSVAYIGVNKIVTIHFLLWTANFLPYFFSRSFIALSSRFMRRSTNLTFLPPPFAIVRFLLELIIRIFFYFGSTLFWSSRSFLTFSRSVRSSLLMIS